MQIIKKPNFAFYVLVGYVFLSFTWWALLLVEKNAEAFNYKEEALKTKWILQSKTNEDFFASADYVANKRQYENQKWMIISEGAVFMLLLLVGSQRLFKSLNKELELNRQQKNFLLSITHELKSPIASAKLVFQTLMRHKTIPVEKSSRLINNGLHDMNRLQNLVENLLLAARIEDHSFKVNPVPFNLSNVVLENIDKATENFEATRNFVKQIEPNVQLNGDVMGMNVVINNLIENAIKYSNDGSTITTSLIQQGHEIILTVADEGIGIEESEREKIFKKFYRIGTEETRSAKGTGLGLFIVERIIQLHEATIEVIANHPKGSIFKIVFSKT